MENTTRKKKTKSPDTNIYKFYQKRGNASTALTNTIEIKNVTQRNSHAIFARNPDTLHQHAHTNGIKNTTDPTDLLQRRKEPQKISKQALNKEQTQMPEGNNGRLNHAQMTLSLCTAQSRSSSKLAGNIQAANHQNLFLHHYIHTCGKG